MENHMVHHYRKSCFNCSNVGNTGTVAAIVQQRQYFEYTIILYAMQIQYAIYPFKGVLYRDNL